MPQSKELLLALINDVHSTEAERSAAREQLYGNERQVQEAIDREITSYLTFDRSLRVRMRDGSVQALAATVHSVRCGRSRSTEKTCAAQNWQSRGRSEAEIILVTARVLAAG
jgi:hypothetical protein